MVREPTVQELLPAADLSAKWIDQYLAADRVRLDGVLVDDLDQGYQKRTAPPADAAGGRGRRRTGTKVRS